jgi:hypothetical protein
VDIAGSVIGAVSSSEVHPLIRMARAARGRMRTIDRSVEIEAVK